MMRAMTARRVLLGLLPFAAFLLGAIVAGLLVGGFEIDFQQAWSHRHDLSNSHAGALFSLRLPRVLLAGLVGAALTLAGIVFQALLRNPLAEPFTLGISSGGAFGAVLAIKLGLDVGLLGFSPVMLLAFAGSLATVGLVYWLARARGSLSSALLILAGVTISFFFAAEILLGFYLSDPFETPQMIRWMMGSLDVVFTLDFLRGSLSAVILRVGAGLAVLAGFAALLLIAGELNQLSLGPELAAARGVKVGRIQRIGLLASSLITGVVVSLAGPIGFVGLIVPHAVRFLVGPDHRLLLPAGILAGAGFLILCDAAARSLLPPTGLPVGILTASLGGPFFMVLLLRAKRRGNI